MVAILTGDIIGSRKALLTENWLIPLKEVLARFGESPHTWEIYRGDSFQLEISDPKAAFEAAVLIKSALKKIKKMDVRIAIGIGEKTFLSDSVSSSNGSAFVRSGDSFDQLKEEKRTLSIATGNPTADLELNIAFRLGLALMDKWTPAMAELVSTSILNPGKSQQEIAAIMNIKQSTVSAGLKRAHFFLIGELNLLYKKKISAIFKI